MKNILLLIAFLSLVSCSSRLTPFTQRLYDEYEWTNEELSNIQFYLSEDIVLKRVDPTGDYNIDDGKIKINSGKEIEEVVIKRGTPGVMVFSPKANRFAISFDKDDDKYLMFGPNPKANGKYVLLGKEWSRYQGKVTYKGEIYQTATKNAYASLMVDIDAARDIKLKKSIATGRKVR